jgi:(1->4)-alpha-D-glucan 1-alpha-D-glucosylmutase
MLDLINRALGGEKSREFLAAFLPLQERVARLGTYNSLAQTTLKLTLPGVPDIYQGAELWDLSLVDPDNRRPVDYDARMAALKALPGRPRPVDFWVQQRTNWRSGAIKLALIKALLDYRAGHPALFADGDYQPIKVDGSNANQVFAFARRHSEEAILVAVTRFPARFESAAGRQDTHLVAPSLPGGWTELLSGHSYVSSESISSSVLFADLPVAVLVPRVTNTR